MFNVTNWPVDCPGILNKKTNKLSVLKEQYAEELLYQKRFYMALSNFGFKDKTKEEMQKLVYSFPVNLPFSETLTRVEKLLSK